MGVVALCMLGAISEDVVTHAPLTQFDSTVVESLHRHVSPFGTSLFLLISRLGAPSTMTLLALAGAVFLALRREWIVFSGWLAAFLGSAVISQWLKLVIHRPRPGYAEAVLHNASWSFPSGHAMGALVGYGMLAYVLMLWCRGDRPRQVAIGLAALVVITAIGISRLYLGVHYFSDVVGGYAAGLLWLCACISLVELGRRSQRLTARLHPTG